MAQWLNACGYLRRNLDAMRPIQELSVILKKARILEQKNHSEDPAKGLSECFEKF